MAGDTKMSQEPRLAAAHAISRVARPGNAREDSTRRLGGGDRFELELRLQRKGDLLATIVHTPAFFQNYGPNLWVEVDGLPVPHIQRADLNPPCLLACIPKLGSHAGTTRLAVGGVDAASHDGEFRVSVFPVEPTLPFSSWATLPARLARRIGIGKKSLTTDGFPYAWFDGAGYLEAYPDVARALVRGEIRSALEHYLRHGRWKKRRLTLATARKPNEGNLADCFDGTAYLARYPDVKEAVWLETMPSALDHFIRHGRGEGREAYMRFDQRAARGTAIELIRKAITENDAAAVKRASGELGHARAELREASANLHGRLAALTRTSNERVDQVQAQLMTLARARQTRERELLSRLEALEAASLLQRAPAAPQAGLQSTTSSQRALGSTPGS
jgi:hypothetical protein